ncbi:MAG: sugar phosphate isomerase/epimerase [Anaerolineae bacterium]
MNRIGAHHTIWSANVMQDAFKLLPIVRRMGYDGIELPIYDPDALDTRALRAAIEGEGLLCTATMGLPPGFSLLDAAPRADTIDRIGRTIRTAAALGASLLGGQMNLPVGELRGRTYSHEEWESAVQAYRQLGVIAADHGVVLALEILNRYIGYFLTTVEDGVRLMDEVDHPSVGLLLDTFHMNIEEKSTPAAIRAAARHLKHFHCSENDRGTVGTGQVPWAAVFEALRKIEYTGWLVVESFAATPDMIARTRTWRPPAASPDELARESILFIRQALAGHRGASISGSSASVR